MKRAIVLTCLALLIPATVVEAHAQLVKAVPEPGAVVGPELKEIRLTFDEAVMAGSSITLFAENFQLVSDVQTHLNGPDMFAPVPALDPGQYTVQWAAVSDDGHTTQGSYQFTVQPGPGARLAWLWWLLLIPVGAGVYLLWRRTLLAPEE
jgi:methionine-rich copper-binding protein CopC